MDLIFSLLPVRRGSTIASVRIGRWLSNFLNVPLIDDGTVAEVEPLRNLFIINGSTLYCHHLEALAKAVLRAEQVIWVQNDYTLPPPKAESNAESPFRRAFADRRLVPHYWTTCEGNTRLTPKSRWLNWNSLGFSSHAPRASLFHEDVIYYGAHRQRREEEFQFMRHAFQELNLSISSTSAKFPSNLLIAPFRDDLYQSLVRFGLGVYLQDDRSMDGRHSPATRFYEMLSVRLPMVFHPSAVKTLARYGYNVSPYVFSEHNAANLVRLRRQIAMEQAAWVDDFEDSLKQKVSEAYEALQSLAS